MKYTAALFLICSACAPVVKYQIVETSKLADFYQKREVEVITCSMPGADEDALRTKCLQECYSRVRLLAAADRMDSMREGQASHIVLGNTKRVCKKVE